MNLENKTQDKNTGKKKLKKVIGLTLLITVGTGIYALEVKNYPKIMNWLSSTYESVVNQISGRKTVYRPKQNVYRPKQADNPTPEVKNYSKNNSSQDRAVDELLSNVEVFPGITTGDVLGGSVIEFYKNTAPDDVGPEITKRTIEALTRKGLEVTEEVTKEVAQGVSDYINNSPEAKEAIQGVSDYLNKPETQEAISQMKEEVSKAREGVSDYMNKPETQEAISKVKDSLSEMGKNLQKLLEGN